MFTTSGTRAPPTTARWEHWLLLVSFALLIMMVGRPTYTSCLFQFYASPFLLPSLALLRLSNNNRPKSILFFFWWCFYLRFNLRHHLARTNSSSSWSWFYSCLSLLVPPVYRWRRFIRHLPQRKEILQRQPLRHQLAGLLWQRGSDGLHVVQACPSHLQPKIQPFRNRQ